MCLFDLLPLFALLPFVHFIPLPFKSTKTDADGLTTRASFPAAKGSLLGQTSFSDEPDMRTDCSFSHDGDMQADRNV